MTFTEKNRRKWIVAAGWAMLLTATPGFALFGIGDIVFDPTSYASLVEQLTTLEMQCELIKNNLTHFPLKQQWQTALRRLENANVANRFGETAAMNTALNTSSPTASATAWNRATVTMSDTAGAYLQAQSLGGSRMAQLAMIETSDSISPDCLTAVGQYRSARSENAPANSSLLAAQFDSSDATNSEVQQLNLLNAAQAQSLAETQSQGALHTCLAAQTTIAAMERRNAAVEDLNTAVFIQQQRASRDMSARGEGSTWQNYIP
jgi:hypothetical protein